MNDLANMLTIAALKILQVTVLLFAVAVFITGFF
jgi:hypothetical protein